MIKIEETKVFNFEGALRGLRNPKNSWHLSDSFYGIGDDDEIRELAGEAAYSYVDQEMNLYGNIIIKFGRFIPNQPSIYDEILGVTLASNNQYAKRLEEI